MLHALTEHNVVLVDRVQKFAFVGCGEHGVRGLRWRFFEFLIRGLFVP